MTTIVSPATNGRQRRSLEDQLNRLDSILDGLADALNEAVADAVKDSVGLAVREAVQAVMTELVTNPLVAAKVAEAHGFGTEQKAEPTWKERFQARLRSMRTAVVAVKNRVVTKMLAAFRLVQSYAQIAVASRRNSAIAIGVGLVIGLSCSLCGLEVASAVSGLAGVVATFLWRMVTPLVPLWQMVSERNSPAGD